jgi:hypothetical protein
MSIEIRAGGDRAEEELRSLYDWLRDEPDVRRYARISLGTGEGKPGGMGGAALEVIKLVTDTAFQSASLALAVAAWRAAHRSTRGQEPEVTISRGGRQVTLTGAGPEDVARVVRALDTGDAEEDTGSGR